MRVLMSMLKSGETRKHIAASQVPPFPAFAAVMSQHSVLRHVSVQQELYQPGKESFCNKYHPELRLAGLGESSNDAIHGHQSPALI